MSDPTERSTDSGIDIDPVYGPSHLEGWEPSDSLGEPGEFPFTRGIYPTMYRGRLWTMRQYSGFGTAERTNERFKFLLDRGQTGLSVAFDLPTQMGYDSDHPRAAGEVGGTGVAISSLADMEILLDGLPLNKVSTSMTINSTAAVLLLLYELVAEKQGVSAAEISGTVQNDILKEYAARGTYIYPPKASMRIITDLFAYCRNNVPKWNTISISGYHMREAGSTAVQEVAFTLSNAIAYCEAAIAVGLAIDEFAPRLSFFFACHMNFFEEIAMFLIDALITDGGLEHLVNLRSLTRLDLSGCNITDEGLRKMADMSWLRMVVLSRTKITDEGLRCFDSYDRLSNIMVDETSVTPAGLEALPRLPYLHVWAGDLRSEDDQEHARWRGVRRDLIVNGIRHYDVPAR